MHTHTRPPRETHSERDLLIHGSQIGVIFALCTEDILQKIFPGAKITTTFSPSKRLTMIRLVHLEATGRITVDIHEETIRWKFMVKGKSLQKKGSLGSGPEMLEIIALAAGISQEQWNEWAKEFFKD